MSLGHFDCINGAFAEAGRRLIAREPTCAPRGKLTTEIIGASFTLGNPQARMPVLPGRKWSLAYAAGELAWYLSGNDTVDFIRYYAPSYGEYSDDGKRLHGAYGPRIFKVQHLFDGLSGNLRQVKGSAWEMCKGLLERDPDTRQAIIPIFSIHDLGLVTKDYPCTLSLQFLRRAEELHLVVNMRSNDLWRGTLYDAFCFTALQELMAHDLGLRCGDYVHQAGSLHLYEADWAKAQPVVQLADDGIGHDGRMKWYALCDANVMPSLISDPSIRGQDWLRSFLVLEEMIRTTYDLDSCLASAQGLLLQRMTGTTLMTLALLWKKAQLCAFEETGKVDVVRLSGAIRQAVGPLVFDNCFGGGAK